MYIGPREGGDRFMEGEGSGSGFLRAQEYIEGDIRAARAAHFNARLVFLYLFRTYIYIYVVFYWGTLKGAHHH